ncbi:hypothetical protein WR43_14195 [Mycolicibacter arupensis]|uniref:Uncharacterized protein n=1 Tax=Mycolicibacter arupensis TaxID=342002 RepID=A0A0F5MWU6_9MYCO|nr:hypothetical protein WR43_14195 [Mycolicibacter arupensis]
MVGLEAEPTPGPIYTGFRTRPLILVSIAVVIDSARRQRRRQTIYAAVMVGVLILGGLVAAIFSSIA